MLGIIRSMIDVLFVCYYNLCVYILFGLVPTLLCLILDMCSVLCTYVFLLKAMENVLLHCKWIPALAIDQRDKDKVNAQKAHIFLSDLLWFNDAGWPYIYPADISIDTLLLYCWHCCVPAPDQVNHILYNLYTFVHAIGLCHCVFMSHWSLQNIILSDSVYIL